MDTNLTTIPAEPRSGRPVAETRLAEAFREIGVLLVALAPLDTLLGATRLSDAWPTALGLIAVGGAFFALGVLAEVRLQNER